MKKLSIIPGRGIRNIWPINPVTRIHENDPRKNKKKARRKARKAISEGLENP